MDDKFPGYDDTPPLGHFNAKQRMDREEPGMSIHPSRDLERRVDRLEEQVRELTKHIAFLFAEYHKEQP